MRRPVPAARRPTDSPSGGIAPCAKSFFVLLLARLLRFPSLANVLLEASPLRLLRILVFLTRVLVLTTRTPVFVARPGLRALRLFVFFFGNPFALLFVLGSRLGTPLELLA